ncbi:hypothetical protein LCGC14_2216900 [marine sediment metagenome]|uniref:Uncharacterized protein n=1 Tax=marine sediment metagenome TaxID=412755 RepID=A0A0F9DZP2_9ZZZZ
MNDIAYMNDLEKSHDELCSVCGRALVAEASKHYKMCVECYEKELAKNVIIQAETQ